MYAAVSSISSPTGTVKIGTLPFTVGSTADGRFRGSGSFLPINMAATCNFGSVAWVESYTAFDIQTRTAGGVFSSNAADIAATSQLFISATYFV